MEVVLFINHKEKQCGVYQYGRRTANILKNYVYCEVSSLEELYGFVELHKPTKIIYNYHASTMPWLGRNNMPDIKSFGMHHEGSKIVDFDKFIIVDSTFIDDERNFAVPRPLFENLNYAKKENTVPVISSFGFGFGNKGFGRLVKTVNDQFDEAIIRLHIPFAFYGDNDKQSMQNIYPGCYAEVKKPGIKLIITNDFLTDSELLLFLSESTINVFLYDEMMGRGLSSVIDYALSVNVPIAITKSDMFRHIYNTYPSICVEDRSLKEIISTGAGVLQQYKDKWSNNNLIKNYEQSLDK